MKKSNSKKISEIVQKYRRIEDRINVLSSLFGQQNINKEQIEEHNYLMFKYEIFSPKEMLLPYQRKLSRGKKSNLHNILRRKPSVVINPAEIKYSCER